MNKTVLIVAIVLAGLPTFARAQDPPPPAVAQDGMTPGEIQKLFDAYIVVESQRALELSDSQYPQFIAKLSKGEFRLVAAGFIDPPKRDRIRPFACPAFHDVTGEIEMFGCRAHAENSNR